MNRVPPEIELHVKKEDDKFRKESDQKYAIKLVERIVFGMVALILTSALVAWIALIIKQ